MRERPADVLQALSSRFTFVVGKGGVGKSTTAAALGLALADAGLDTHLVSVDPAHSLADVLNHRWAADGPARSPCSPRLTVEEVDLRGQAEQWIRRFSAEVAELVELGTYLDADRVPDLLEPALPGLGEVVAAFRLAELEGGDADQIVVDTPPAAHAMRLLACDDVLAGWVEALGAMAEKAGAVQERLLRRRARLAGEALVDELRETALRFRERVVGAADFVVIESPEPAARAEADRLETWIGARGGRVAARLDPGKGAKAEVGRSGGPRGCDTLRGWWSGARARDRVAQEGGTAAAGASETAAPGSREGGAGEPEGAAAGPFPEDLQDLLGGRELLLFAGKGGVGKSTAAAACALAFARDRPVLLVGTDPGGALGNFGGSRGEGQGPGSPGLSVRTIDPERELDTFRTAYRHEVEEAFRQMGLDRSAVLDRRVMESLLGLAPPGVDELFALKALVEGTDEDRGEGSGEARVRPLLVVDGASTGHFLRLVEMPEPALAWSHTVMRLILEQRAASRLEGVTRDLLELARGLRRLIRTLRDPARTGVVVVTVDEPVVRAETERLTRTLVNGWVPVVALLLNRWDGVAPEGFFLQCSNPTPEATRAVPLVGAPEMDDAPIGPRALRDFFSRWQVVS